MNTEIVNAVTAADIEAQYDEKSKRLLGHKTILSHIFVKTIDEFKGMNPRNVEKLIEGEPIIGKVPVEPGLTNVAVQDEDGKRIVGINTESSEVNEGLVRYDIICYVRMPSGRAQIIVNVEAQKDEPTSYNILNRAIFYVSRLVSSQKERDFVNSKYNDIKRVFSIWICMNMDECVWDYVHLTDDKILGRHRWKGKLDLLNIVLIGLPKVIPERGEQYELHRLLTVLLSMELPVGEKLSVMNDEYDISVGNSEKEAMGLMCNLSQGILERGIEQGVARGRQLMLLDLLQDIGEVPEDVKNTVCEQTDVEVLKVWTKAAVKACNIEEWREEIMQQLL